MLRSNGYANKFSCLGFLSANSKTWKQPGSACCVCKTLVRNQLLIAMIVQGNNQKSVKHEPISKSVIPKPVRLNFRETRERCPTWMIVRDDAI